MEFRILILFTESFSILLHKQMWFETWKLQKYITLCVLNFMLFGIICK